MIRPATLQDIPALQTMLRASYGQILTRDYPARVIQAALPAMCQLDADYLRTTHYRVWDPGAEPIGAVGWSVINPQTASLRKLAVHPAQLRQGIGRRLMTSIEQDAALSGHRQIDCASSLTAVPFYQSCGYHVTGTDTIQTPLPGITFAIVTMTKQL